MYVLFTCKLTTGQELTITLACSPALGGSDTAAPTINCQRSMICNNHNDNNDSNNKSNNNDNDNDNNVIAFGYATFRYLSTPSPPTKSLDFRGFDSSRLLMLRGGYSHVRRILIGGLPESLTQGLLAGKLLVGGLGVIVRDQ